MNQEVVLCFDFDGVICNNNGGDYENAEPYELSIKNINAAYNSGYKIVIFTARYSNRFPDRQYQHGYEEGVNWLRKHGVKFHEFRMGKPPYALIADDRAVRIKGDDPNIVKQWQNFWQEVANLKNVDSYNQKVNDA